MFSVSLSNTAIYIYSKLYVPMWHCVLSHILSKFKPFIFHTIKITDNILCHAWVSHSRVRSYNDNKWRSLVYQTYLLKTDLIFYHYYKRTSVIFGQKCKVLVDLITTIIDINIFIIRYLILLCSNNFKSIPCTQFFF